jgi:hypothetical protein
MGGQKTLTIGVTVNLEHYENLRLEVKSEVDSPEDAENLSRFLDTILGSFGRNDQATAERVNSYRRRVLPGFGRIAADGNGSKESLSPSEDEVDRQNPDTSPFASATPPISVVTPSAASEDQTLTCASCGAPVSPAEQKMSQLFTSRTLCRVCMKNL